VSRRNGQPALHSSSSRRAGRSRSTLTPKRPGESNTPPGRRCVGKMRVLRSWEMSLISVNQIDTWISSLAPALERSYFPVVGKLHYWCSPRTQPAWKARCKAVVVFERWVIGGCVPNKCSTMQAAVQTLTALERPHDHARHYSLSS
jgi:hypothetical protein